MQGKESLVHMLNLFASLACLQCSYCKVEGHFQHKYSVPMVSFLLIIVNVEVFYYSQLVTNRYLKNISKNLHRIFDFECQLEHLRLLLRIGLHISLLIMVCFLI